MSGRLKMTSQRELVLQYLRDSDGHPTADEIYRHLRSKLPRTSKKTVYNNLKALSGAGMVREISTMGVKRYEADMRPHHHLICLVCDRVSDVEDEELTALANRFAEDLRDFEVSSTTTHFYGVCKDCKERR